MTECGACRAGHRLRRTLLERLQAVLRALRPLQSAAAAPTRRVALHLALALSQALLLRCARLPAAGWGGCFTCHALPACGSDAAFSTEGTVAHTFPALDVCRRACCVPPAVPPHR